MKRKKCVKEEFWGETVKDKEWRTVWPRSNRNWVSAGLCFSSSGHLTCMRGDRTTPPNPQYRDLRCFGRVLYVCRWVLCASASPSVLHLWSYEEMSLKCICLPRLPGCCSVTTASLQRHDAKKTPLMTSANSPFLDRTHKFHQDEARPGAS